MVVPNVRVSCKRRRRLFPLPGTRTVATTVSRCTSRPAHRSTITSTITDLLRTDDRTRRPGGASRQRIYGSRSRQQLAVPQAPAPYSLTRYKQQGECRRRPRRRRHSHPKAVTAPAPPGLLLTIKVRRQLVATGGNGFWLVSAVFRLGAFAAGCHWLRPRGSINAPSSWPEYLTG